jgi:hypothetical protein
MTTIQTKRPNTRNHIAIYYPVDVDSKTIEDIAIKEILELCGTLEFSMNFTYAIYTDNSLISENIFVPIFHTYYLNSEPKIVVIRDSLRLALDILELYPYHDFCLYKDENSESNFKFLQDRFPNHKLRLISSLKELL